MGFGAGAWLEGALPPAPGLDPFALGLSSAGGLVEGKGLILGPTGLDINEDSLSRCFNQHFKKTHNYIKKIY
jgi:hypothetical protein